MLKQPYRQKGVLALVRTNAVIILSLTALIVMLNITIQRMFRIRRELIIEERLTHMRASGLPQLPSTALITMSDPSFQDCMLQLIRSARNIGWKEPIYLLAIDYHLYDEETVKEIDELGIFVVRTRPIFDSWLDKNDARQKSYRRLEPKKFRKMEVFLNPVFRTYERLIYLDADGFLTSLEPMVRVSFPENATILMRQNDHSFNKLSLHRNELKEEFLSTNQTKLLQHRYPDRAKSGATSYFIVDVNKLPSPVKLFSRSIEILCNFRSAFRLNDQTLLNFLFYNELAMFPHCGWDEIVVMDEPQRLLRYCMKNMQLQRWLLGHISFMYRHMAVEEKKECVRSRVNRYELLSNKTLASGLVEPADALYFEARTFSSCQEAAQAWRKLFQQY